MVIGPGRVKRSLRVVCARANRASAACTRPRSRSGAVDGRHHRLVAVVADAHLDPPGEIDPLDVLEKAVHEMLARLLAVADDVDAGILLQLDREQRRIEFSGFEFAPDSRQAGHSFCGSASQIGFGSLPETVVGNSVIGRACARISGEFLGGAWPATLNLIFSFGSIPTAGQGGRGETGRRKGLKIPRPMAVRVRSVARTISRRASPSVM